MSLSGKSRGKDKLYEEEEVVLFDTIHFTVKLQAEVDPRRSQALSLEVHLYIPLDRSISLPSLCFIRERNDEQCPK